MRAPLAQAGLALDERFVRYGPIDLAAASRMMREILSQEERLTVVATNDVFAVGAMMACRERGVAIPDEISITGVDNAARRKRRP
jgi:LacI family transcriptional regulator